MDARERSSQFGAVSVEYGLAPRLLAVRCGAAPMAASEAVRASQTLLGRAEAPHTLRYYPNQPCGRVA